MQSPPTYIPQRAVAERYNVCSLTIDNWVAREALGFPKPIKINSRKYFDASELDAFDNRAPRPVSPSSNHPKSLDEAMAEIEVRKAEVEALAQLNALEEQRAKLEETRARRKAALMLANSARKANVEARRAAKGATAA